MNGEFVAVSSVAAVSEVRLGDVVKAYVALTKPRIIELLLVTTLPAMFLAAGGVPPWQLMLVTFVGGLFAAADLRLRRRLVLPALRRPLPSNDGVGAPT